MIVKGAHDANVKSLGAHRFCRNELLHILSSTMSRAPGQLTGKVLDDADDSPIIGAAVTAARADGK